MRYPRVAPGSGDAGVSCRVPSQRAETHFHHGNRLWAAHRVRVPARGHWQPLHERRRPQRLEQEAHLHTGTGRHSSRQGRSPLGGVCVPHAVTWLPCVVASTPPAARREGGGADCSASKRAEGPPRLPKPHGRLHRARRPGGGRGAILHSLHRAPGDTAGPRAPTDPGWRQARGRASLRLWRRARGAGAGALAGPGTCLPRPAPPRARRGPRPAGVDWAAATRPRREKAPANSRTQRFPSQSANPRPAWGCRPWPPLRFPAPAAGTAPAQGGCSPVLRLPPPPPAFGAAALRGQQGSGRGLSQSGVAPQRGLHLATPGSHTCPHPPRALHLRRGPWRPPTCGTACPHCFPPPPFPRSGTRRAGCAGG